MTTIRQRIPIVVLGTVVLLLLSTTRVIGSASAQSAPTTASGSTIMLPPQPVAIGSGDGLDTIAGCVSANGRLLVEVLFDSSGSLRTTDPDALRVPALKAALSALLSITNTQSKVGPARVDVEISRFDDSYYRGGGFRPLDSSTIDSFLAEADSFRTEDRGQWTDYVLALRGANDSIEARSSELQADGVKPCKAIFWFTDGSYDISGTRVGAKDYAPGLGGTAAATAGRAALCSPDGIADQLRRAGIVNVAVVLNTTNFSSDLLEGIVLGAQSCGTSDGASRFGYVLGVEDVNLLTTAMLEAVTGTRGLAQTPGQVCDQDPCPRRVDVRVPVGVGSFFLITRAADGVQRWLTAPGGQPRKMEQGRSTLDGSRIEATRISPTTLMFDVNLDPALPAAGLWTVSFVDPSGSASGTLAEVDAYFFGALRPIIEPGSRIREGEVSDIVVQVADASGAPVDLATAQRSRLSVTVTDPVSGAVTRAPVVGPDSSGRFTARYTAAIGSKAVAMNVTATLSVIMDGGLALRPSIAESAVPVIVPVTVPSLEDTELLLPRVEGRGTARGTLSITGPERGAGRACIVDWRASEGGIPQSVGSVSLVSSELCQTVQPGTSGDLQVAVRPDKQGEGFVSGLVEVRLSSATDGTEVIKNVPVKFRVIREVSASTQWLTAIGLSLLALLLPLALFLVILKQTTRFRGRIRFAEIPVRLVDGGIERTDSSTTDSGSTVSPGFGDPVDGDWQYVVIDGVRSFSTGRHHSFTVTIVDSLFGLSSAVVTVDRGSIVGRVRHRDRLRRLDGAAMTLDLSGQWAFVIDSIEFPPIDEMFGATAQPTDADRPIRTVVTGSVLMFVDDWSGYEERVRQLFFDVKLALPGILESAIADAWALYRASPPPAGENAEMIGVGAHGWSTDPGGGQSTEPGWASSSPPSPFDPPSGPTDLPPPPWA